MLLLFGFLNVNDIEQMSSSLRSFFQNCPLIVFNPLM